MGLFARRRRVTTFDAMVVAIIFIVMLVTSASMNLQMRKNNKENFARNPKTEGVIKNVREEKRVRHYRGRRHITTYKVIDVSYNVNGKEYTSDFRYDGANSSMIGKSIKVAYQSYDPNVSYIDNMGPDNLMSVVTSGKFLRVLGLGIFSVGIVFFCAVYKR